MDALFIYSPLALHSFLEHGGIAVCLLIVAHLNGICIAVSDKTFKLMTA